MRDYAKLNPGDDDPECTGLTARWCPVHGDCTCVPENPSDHEMSNMNDPTCPLHGRESDHAEGKESECMEWRVAHPRIRPSIVEGPAVTEEFARESARRWNAEGGAGEATVECRRVSPWKLA